MAAIDKIYGTQEEHDEFRAWCEKYNPDLLKYFYLKDGYLDRQRPITNFPTWADMWVWENCPIGWVKDRIREQYNGPPHE